MYRIKPWEELTIQDDYMFKLIMGVKRICLSLLQSILHVEIADIHYLETEKSVDARYQGKGIRMDVYVRDDANTVYNIEMQVRMPEGKSLFKRTRYYQSMIDADLLILMSDQFSSYFPNKRVDIDTPVMFINPILKKLQSFN